MRRIGGVTLAATLMLFHRALGMTGKVVVQ
jgi:hypothetical protein